MLQKKPEYYGDYSPTTVRSLLPDAVPTENLFFDQSTNDPLQIISSKDLACDEIPLRITKNEIKKISANKGNENSFGQPIPVIDKRTCPNVTLKEVNEVGIQCSLIISNEITDNPRTKIIIDPNSTLSLRVPVRAVGDLTLMIMLIVILIFLYYQISFK